MPYIMVVASMFMSQKFPHDWADSTMHWRMCRLEKMGKIEFFEKMETDYYGKNRKVSYVKVKNV